MASNKVATVVLLDVGSSMNNNYDCETFFKKCQWCLLRIIQRKIFSDENDELAIVLCGCEDTENDMACTSEEGMYNNICEYTPMQKPNWDIYEKVQSLTTTEITNSNWIEGLFVCRDYMQKQTRGKRIKDRQVVVLSNFSAEMEKSDKKIKLLAESLNLDNMKFVVIGIDLEEECKDKNLDSQLSGSIGSIFTLVDKVQNAISLSFSEAEEDIIYYERKRKMSRFSKVNLTIGSKIDIPIRWIKLTLDPTRIRWVKKPSDTPTNQIDMARSKSKPEPEIRYIMETQKVTKFGETEVVLSYADMEAMQRQTGPPSCTLLGCIKRQRISRKMLVGKEIYLVVPEKNDDAQRMLSAFIDALIEADKYALVRRVTVKNGKIKLGILVPVSNENGKELYFLQLPFKEHAMVVPYVVLPEPNNCEILSNIDNLIDAMTIPDKPKDITIKDPKFQLRSHILSLYQTGQLSKDSADPELPKFIQNICEPYPDLKENASNIIEKLEKMLPIEYDKPILQPEESNVQSIIKKDVDIKKKEVTSHIKQNTQDESKMDWVEADTEEWQEEMKEKYRNIKDNTAIPPIKINEEKLLKNKYNTDYISENIWKKFGSKSKLHELSDDSRDNSETEQDSGIQQMLAERHSTETSVDTAEMLQRLKRNLEK